MRIKKVSQTTSTQAQVVDGYSTSTTDSYSCNYVNGIIENGNNTNGKYTKFLDGTLICWGNITGVTTPANSGTDITITLPQEFLNTYYVINTELQNPQAYWGKISHCVKEKTTTNFKFNTWNNGDNANSNQGYTYIAIGKWK